MSRFEPSFKGHDFSRAEQNGKEAALAAEGAAGVRTSQSST
jgi:hypothetical protein